ncbi:MAG TPA: hypothetical protein VJV78_30195, partial [Polyangiales bacterium]|nr:hypothetical protein [Polyangiales bacterium]
MSEAERKRSSLREQLSRAKGALADSLGISANARASKRAAAESKQRLSAVLWNDRTMAASQVAASDHPPTPTASQPAPAAPPAPPAGAPPLQMPSPHTARAR